MLLRGAGGRASLSGAGGASATTYASAGCGDVSTTCGPGVCCVVTVTRVGADVGATAVAGRRAGRAAKMQPVNPAAHRTTRLVVRKRFMKTPRLETE